MNHATTASSHKKEMFLELMSFEYEVLLRLFHAWDFNLMSLAF